ncbi:MAG: acyclic terpene utilization AtuA family protein [Planctomycetota bacterium]
MADRLRIASWHALAAGPVNPATLEGVDVVLVDFGGELTTRWDANAEIKESLEQTLDALGPHLYLHPELTVIANVGGCDTWQMARAVAAKLEDSGNASLPVGVVRGHDVGDQLEELLQQGATLPNLNTGEAFKTLRQPTVAALARLGAKPIALAIAGGARLVVAGGADMESMIAGAAAELLGASRDVSSSWTIATAANLLDRTASVLDIDVEGAVGIVVGDSEAQIETSNPRDAATGVESEDGEPTTAIDIIYRESFVAAAVLRIDRQPNEASPEDWGTRFSESLPDELLDKTKLTVERYHGDDACGLLLVRAEAATEQIADEVKKWMQMRFAPRDASAMRIHRDFPPRSYAKYGCWPTEAPSRLIEWTVEVHQADWWLG